jgi:hypothetical protein
VPASLFPRIAQLERVNQELSNSQDSVPREEVDKLRAELASSRQMTDRLAMAVTKGYGWRTRPANYDELIKRPRKINWTWMNADE